MAEEGPLSERVAVLVSAVVGFAVAIGVTWYVSGPADTFYEAIFRIGPTVEGGGVGADFVVGNTMPSLKLLIDVIHFVDFAMGFFILLMLFIHWGAFRRLAARMQPPAGEETVATDGGENQ
ncbi:hypothetical protein [Halospeciosus flavus]|uniref:Uncharacterized protein n=1 Tax=Halospeciosus flavus TaxID=3032283 RepID=A0ABD5Z4G3_9EURY|nr:hypothetical protein [Halospeciosus flavus]